MCIRDRTETQLNLFRHRQDTIDKNRRSQGEFFSEYQRIFYDTDYIHEEQQMRLRNCPDCCGFRMLESTAQQRNGKLYRVLCISVPINCCSACHDQGAEVYQEMIRYDRYDYVYLQDRIKREYRSFNTEKAEESIIK